jgi:hypothetical protein
VARLDLTWKQAVVSGLVGVVGTVYVLVTLAIVSLGTCLGAWETSGVWAWSPVFEYCDGETTASKAVLAVLAAPALLAAVGAILWSKLGRGWALLAFGLVLLAPLLPARYVTSLPLYYKEFTPVLHNPYLRVASDSRPARACYIYGIVHGRRRTVVTPDTERVCVDFEPTPEASALTPKYDQGATERRLELLGHALTANDLEPGAEFEGLVAARVYRLPGAEARRDSTLIRSYPS